MYMNKEQVLKFLPHRNPFLFIDSIESVLLSGESADEIRNIGQAHTAGTVDKKDLVGCTVTAHYQVRNEMEVLRGHFPGNPIVPGVVQVEMMAQASCFTVVRLLADPLNVKLEVALLKVEEAKFRRPIRPGMNLVIKSHCHKVRGQMMSYDCTITCENEIMAEASLLAMANF